MKNSTGFTMVELMVVVLIVGILAAVMVPLMSERADASKWSEAKVTMGSIATAVRAYAAEKGNDGVSGTPSFSDLGISSAELDGAYFTNQCYSISNVAISSGVVSFTITCDATQSQRDGAPKSPSGITLTANSSGQVFTNGISAGS